MGNPVVHFEIGCQDKARTIDFYSHLLDWKIDSGPAGLIDTGSGIGGHFTSLGHEPHHYTTFYVEVHDLQAYLDKAGSLGGKTLVPPVTIPGQGSFAWMADPEGNVLGVWKPEASRQS